MRGLKGAGIESTMEGPASTERKGEGGTVGNGRSSKAVSYSGNGCTKGHGQQYHRSRNPTGVSSERHSTWGTCSCAPVPHRPRLACAAKREEHARALPCERIFAVWGTLACIALKRQHSQPMLRTKPHDEIPQWSLIAVAWCIGNDSARSKADIRAARCAVCGDLHSIPPSTAAEYSRRAGRTGPTCRKFHHSVPSPAEVNAACALRCERCPAKPAALLSVSRSPCP